MSSASSRATVALGDAASHSVRHTTCGASSWRSPFSKLRRYRPEQRPIRPATVDRCTSSSSPPVQRRLAIADERARLQAVRQAAQTQRQVAVATREALSDKPFLLMAEGENANCPMTKHALAPRDTFNCDEGQQAEEPPTQPQQNATQNKPQEITNSAHSRAPLATAHVDE